MWLQILGIGFSIVSACISAYIFVMIKINDIKHIQISVEKIEKSVEEIKDNDEKMKLAIVKIQTQCVERHERTNRKVKR